MNDSDCLPGMEGSVSEPAEPAVSVGAPRLIRADRSQMFMETVCLEDRLPSEHPARTIWSVVDGLDLSAFYQPIKARGSDPGRPAIDPKTLVGLWLYATIEGVGSARELSRLCSCHDAYRWLCGGIAVNHHTLSDFRVGQQEALDKLLTQLLASLVHSGVVTAERISQDGTRIRASAGTSSFRGESTLWKRFDAARQQVEHLKSQLDGSVPARKRAARARAAEQKLKRVERALQEVQRLDEAKRRQKKKPSKDRPARASTTDPDAHIMRMPDHGFRPAYNAQVAVDTASRAVVGVQASTSGSDANESVPMREQVERRTNRKVEEHLMDGGYVGLDSVQEAEASGVRVYAPPPEPKKKGGSPYDRRKTDSDEIAQWRERMGTAVGQVIYKQRAATSETVNADLKAHRGLASLPVRGQPKAQCLLLWWALAYNIMHFSSNLLT